ncbi:outer membrane lipoprotein carrier protein LolA [Neisseria elongata subsp. glycolytica ATCC 29315]|uniref:Outer-membrane lipoprotein carrier protein n=1 Tax=Neisseria elongata subsp. glycolytica ATCC 29315 TaxID=546263 RepID=D4DQM7_NEIEG|nr:outer membrane lipoprotein carrier protein LolA [Neisseria elongata subsp. glycolytica ATCC 29315]
MFNETDDLFEILRRRRVGLGNRRGAGGRNRRLEKIQCRCRRVERLVQPNREKQKKTQTSGGTFQIMRPGLFRWEYSKPYKQTIVGDGQHIWLYDVDLKQVTKSDQSQAIGDSPASILSDKNALDSSYSLKEDGSGDGIDYVLATPKKNNAGYQFIRIGFKGETLAAMELKDGFGNQTSIKFSNVNTHPNLSRGNFKFVPPKGVDVLSQ